MAPSRGIRRAVRAPQASESAAVATIERSKRLGSPARGTDRSQSRAIAFLGDVLIGDSNWSMDEVTRLLALHTLVAVGRRRVVGLDDLPAGAD